jgi:hypothetical protein
VALQGQITFVKRGIKNPIESLILREKLELIRKIKKELVTGIEPVDKKPIIVVVIGFLKFPWEV